jgi:hypothetical protein
MIVRISRFSVMATLALSAMAADAGAVPDGTATVWRGCCDRGLFIRNGPAPPPVAASDDFSGTGVVGHLTTTAGTESVSGSSCAANWQTLNRAAFVCGEAVSTFSDLVLHSSTGNGGAAEIQAKGRARPRRQSAVIGGPTLSGPSVQTIDFSEAGNPCLQQCGVNCSLASQRLCPPPDGLSLVTDEFQILGVTFASAFWDDGTAFGVNPALVAGFDGGHLVALAMTIHCFAEIRTPADRPPCPNVSSPRLGPRRTLS